jgi:hypothetical protein
MRFLLGIYWTYWRGRLRRHITGIYHVSTMYIPCIYRSGSDIPVIYQEYSLYILHGLSLEYILYIPSISIVCPQYIHDIYLVYIYSIFEGYTMYIFGIYNPLGGWCCGGGQGPITSNHIAWTSHNFICSTPAHTWDSCSCGCGRAGRAWNCKLPVLQVGKTSHMLSRCE